MLRTTVVSLLFISLGAVSVRAEPPGRGDTPGPKPNLTVVALAVVEDPGRQKPGRGSADDYPVLTVTIGNMDQAPAGAAIHTVSVHVDGQPVFDQIVEFTATGPLGPWQSVPLTFFLPPVPAGTTQQYDVVVNVDVYGFVDESNEGDNSTTQSFTL